MTTTRRSRSVGTADFTLADSTGLKMPFRVAVDPQTKAVMWRQGWAQMLSDEQRISGPFSAQQYPAVIDIPLTFETWEGGAGFTEVDDREGSPKNYNYSQGIDASIPGRLYLSPKVNAMRTDVAVAPTYFADVRLGLFAACGRYMYKFTASSLDWVQVHDLGATFAFTGPPVEFNSVLFAPAGDAKAYVSSTDGITWTASTLGDPYANKFAVRGRTSTTPQLWKISSVNVLKSNTDGTNGGAVAWSAAIPMGHTSETNQSLVSLDDRLFNFKTEGFSGYPQTPGGAEVEEIWAGGRLMRRTGNGVNAFVWVDGAAYIPYGDRLMRYDPLANSGIGSFSYVLPLADWVGNAQLNGTITAITGDADWLYVAMKNAAGYTYILKGRPGYAWHTFVYLGANGCNAMIVTAPASVATSNPAILLGYGTATRYIILARSGLRPEDDTNYRFNTSTGTLYGPWLRVGTKLWSKFLNTARASAENCTSGKPITIGYQTDPLVATTTLHTASEDGATYTAASTSVQFERIRPVITMYSPDDTTSPRCLGAMLNTILASPRKRIWRIEAICRPETLGVGGGTVRVDSRQQESFLFRAHGDGTLLTLYDRDARTFTVRILSLDEALLTAHQPADGHVYSLTLVEITETTQTDSTFTLDSDELDGVRVIS